MLHCGGVYSWVDDDVNMGWLRKVQVGDIVRSRRGTERVVRAVSQQTLRTWLIFSIMHCSWTGRCYTNYCTVDLRTMGYRPTGKRLKLRDKMSRRIAKAIRTHDLSHRNGRAPNCCDVHGIR